MALAATLLVTLGIAAGCAAAVDLIATIRVEICEQYPERWEKLLALHDALGRPLKPSQREFAVTEELTPEQVAVVREANVESSSSLW